MADLQALRVALSRPGREVYLFPSVGSTNRRALELARSLGGEAVVMALEQTAGRGRRGRAWQTTAGSLALSILLRPQQPPRRYPDLSFVVAVAVAMAVEDLTALSVELKWPNDLLVRGRKVGGILGEADVEAGVVVLGVGVNRCCPPAGLPAEAATSLEGESGRVVPLADLARRIVEEADRWRACWEVQGLAPALVEWRRRAVYLGQEVSVVWDQECLQGVAEGIGEDGSLLLRLRGGALRPIHGGTLRPLSAEPPLQPQENLKCF